MNTVFKKFPTASVLFTLTAASLWAQSNSVSLTESNAAIVAAPLSHGAACSTDAVFVNAMAKWVFSLVIIGMYLYFRHRRNQMVHETMRNMIEKGMPITPELVAELTGKRRSRLMPGLIMTGIGAALLITNLNRTNPGKNMEDYKLGCMLLFIGVAFLTVWLMERKSKKASQTPKL